ncbi:cation:proton antiporter [Nocardioides sp. Y6]|uniref:Cation:proton antiporter n=1 Tax=Nocardioides malaquae TaxID=2773426 RepID=A0ABR9RW10_9ACTN|nr:monovalent cation/H+ antiporter complex subunit F [Nocardioides malaquae]MBE7325768.1 cation:proton antiporter [Nocardioides malaquae]
MTYVLVAAGGLLVLAGVLLVVRMTVGPTILDRSMALDVLMSVMVCAVSLKAIHREESWAIPMLLALAMIGFVGAVSIARYASGAEDIDTRDDERDDEGVERR